MFNHLREGITGLRHAWRSVQRGWRGGELGLLFFSLVIAVAMVSGVGGFSDRLNRAMAKQSHHFLAADSALRATREAPVEWLDKAASIGLRQSTVLSFRSMLFAGDNMQLASVRAASADYPLRGTIVVSDTLFGTGTAVERGPSAGEIWLDSRLFALLGIVPGATVTLGDVELLATKALVSEPDAVSAFNAYGLRALMSAADVVASGVVQPGSQISYRYLFAGEAATLMNFKTWLEPERSAAYRWLSPTDDQPAVAQALDRAERYLLLAACMGIALAGTAIAQAARLYVRNNLNNVAIMKTLGASRRVILRDALYQIVIILLCSSVVGIAAGLVLQWGLFASIKGLLSVALPPVGWRTVGLGVMTSSLCCAVFALPPVWRLSRVSPLRVLRRDTSETDRGIWSSAIVGLGGIALMMYLFSGDAALSAILFAALLGLTVTATGLVFACMLLIGRRSTARTVTGRLVLASLQRRRAANAFQIASLGLALTALLSLGLLRTTLLKDWQLQLENDSPNQFLINIQQDERTALENFFADHAIAHAGIFPMVRGRLAAINGQGLQEYLSVDDDGSGLDREINLSWAANLPDDNRITGGVWWTDDETTEQVRLPVSVEAEFAERLGLEIGSQLEFDIGGQRLSAHVTSLRSLNWASMRPNFYFLFPDGSLRAYASTYITSFRVSESQRPVLVDLLNRFSTMTLIDIDAALTQIQLITAQLTAAVGLVLTLIVVCALLVAVANVRSSFSERQRENAILRVLGASNRLLWRVLLFEFAGVGLIAGILASAAANGIVAVLQGQLLDMQAVIYLDILLWVPLLAACAIAILAWWNCRRLLADPPLRTLMSAQY